MFDTIVGIHHGGDSKGTVEQRTDGVYEAVTCCILHVVHILGWRRLVN